MAASWERVVGSVERLLPPGLADYETEVLAVAAVSTLLAFVVLLWLVCGGRRGKSKHVCFLGLSHSGKTLVFLQLVYGQYRETQVSIKENKAEYTAANKGAVEVVDVPGDERVRQRLFNKYKDSLRAVVVVIDSDNFPSEVRSVAELIYDLLLESAVLEGRAPVLMACNKQDLALAKDCATIQAELEKEISTLRVSRSAKLSLLGSKGRANSLFIGQEGKDFEFSDLPKRVRVKFVECSARGQGEERRADIDDVTSWIAQHC
jgi:GTPase SAR1 family protein